MAMPRTVSEFMTTHPTVVEVTDTLRAVAQTMATQDVGALVVAEDGAVVGIITDRDLVVRGVAEGIGLDAPVGQLTTGALVTVAPDDDVARVVQLMRDNAVRRVPVVEGTQAVGVISIGDLAVALDADSALADISAAPATE
jgi:CBS domain-containing protein